jgi:hypothetical protein
MLGLGALDEQGKVEKPVMQDSTPPHETDAKPPSGTTEQQEITIAKRNSCVLTSILRTLGAWEGNANHP